MMAGENVKASVQTFNKHYPRQRVHAIFHRGLRCRYKSFDDFIQHQLQALIFGYLFIKKKVKALRWLTEARQREGKETETAIRFPPARE